jgi:Fe-S-cluster-containing hydrogenase component 2
MSSNSNCGDCKECVLRCPLESKDFESEQDRERAEKEFEITDFEEWDLT